MAILDDLLTGDSGTKRDHLYQNVLRKAASSAPSQQLQAISATSIVIAKKLIEISRQLQDDGKHKLARDVLDQAADLLDNNEQLQKVVGDIKARID